jgi:Flp pilus assembly protein protease CpaA
MGPATGVSIPYHLPFCSPSEAATLTARIPTEVLVAAAAATDVRNQRVADLTTLAGSAAHAVAIASCATEEEAAQAAQTATGAALTTAQAAIAEADATNSTP